MTQLWIQLNQLDRAKAEINFTSINQFFSEAHNKKLHLKNPSTLNGMAWTGI